MKESNSIMSKEVIGSVLVVGGGIAGIQAALDLANSGYYVYMIEKKSAIGGVMAQLDKTFPTNDCSMCIISPKLVECGRHLNINLMTLTEIEKISGKPGNFNVKLKQNPRYIDINKCTACGECAKICPIETLDEFDQNLTKRKAAFKQYPQAMPSAYTILKKGTSPCKSSCPVNPSIQGCIALMIKKDYKAAYELFREEHPMPGICGRICNHPCENSCTRSKVDHPISIMALHRFLGDWAIKNHPNYVPKIKKTRTEKIAIIGSGPAGLTCAYFLAIEGFQVVVFEKSNSLGGMLTLGIPPYRLPREIIDTEINVLKKIGVKFKTNINIGKDITIGELRKQEYKAFFVGIGAHECKMINIEEEFSHEVLSGIDYLRKINTGTKIDIGNNVAVIGGGNVAIDVVRTALREGSKKPFIIYRRSIAEMPANKEEIEECLEEGIKIRTLTHPVRIIKTGKKVTAIECVEVKLGKADASGRKRPELIHDSKFIIKTDSIISAIGQKSNLECLTSECSCIVTTNGTIEIDKTTFQTKDSDIFAGGDVTNGPGTVIESMSDGKKAAKSIKHFICNDNTYKPDIKFTKTIDHEDIPTLHIQKKNRQQMPLSNPEIRKQNIDLEVQLGFSEKQVQKELKRCLACGICSECYQCVKSCLAEAIDHNMNSTEHEIQVGAIILASGFTPFNPKNYPNYNYISHPNILTSLEFERILSASGPFAGHMVRPSDHKEPDKIAWIQCVGSRDINRSDHSYCSSVCCMYTNKQTVIAKEHSKKQLDTAVFFIDMRTFGKDFEKYYNRAKYEKGVRYIRSRIHTIDPVENDNLLLRYITEEGKIIEEVFDIVILAIGLSPNKNTIELSKKINININKHLYPITKTLKPVNTSKEGIFVCGAFQEPKDIPQSVMEASAAAASAIQLLSSARGTLIKTKQLPPELNISTQKPRVGVFVCNCGINIGGVANVPSIRDYAATLPHVVHVEDNLFTCSQDSQDKIKKTIKEKKLNRIVVASCSPRTHEEIFQETIRDAGLNKYLFEMANIRDQNTWVHMTNPKKATEKAKYLVKMAVAKVIHNKSLHQVQLNVIQKVLIIGAGVAGIESALGIANQGLQVYLVEKSNILGGIAQQLHSTWQGESIKPYLEKLINKVLHNSRIKIFTNTEVVETEGTIGNFSTVLMTSSESLLETTVNHGATIIATGGKEYIPNEYLYGTSKKIITHLELDNLLNNKDQTITNIKSTAFIQCVGSRNDERPYCSKLCCTHTLKSALLLKEKNQDLHIYIIYRDIRSYGFREELYHEARKKGIIFIRYTPEKNEPKITNEKNNNLYLTMKDHVLQIPIKINIDLLVLATAVVPNKNKDLFELFKLPTNSDGFLIEAHSKLRPVDFSSEGIFMAGLAHYPKALDESIAQAKASVSRVMTILSKDTIMVGGIIAQVNPDKCSACLTCVRNCPYNIPSISMDGHAHIEAAECHGCGSCVSECPGKAIQLNHFTDKQIIAKIDALFLC